MATAFPVRFGPLKRMPEQLATVAWKSVGALQQQAFCLWDGVWQVTGRSVLRAEAEEIRTPSLSYTTLSWYVAAGDREVFTGPDENIHNWNIEHEPTCLYREPA